MSNERIEVVDVTPALAERWLGHNTHNRKPRPRDVSAYARDMQNGDWFFTAEPLRFDINNVLIDGQHRLFAVVESGVTVKMLVVWGLAPEAQDAVDTNITRKFYDVLDLHGESNAAQLASIVNAVHAWESGSRRIGDGSVKPTNPEKLATLAKHPELRDIARDAGRVAARCALPASIVGLCWWLFDQLDSEDAAYFFERLADDTGHTKGDPIYELRRTAAESKDVRGERNRTWLAAITIKAWNAYRDGAKIGLLRFKVGGSKPERFPEPR